MEYLSDYNSLLNIHIGCIVVYLLFFCIKVGMLLLNYSGLDLFRKKVKWPIEVFLPSIYLFVGVLLANKSGQWAWEWFFPKLICIVLSAVLGIIAFKHKNKLLGISSLVFFIVAIVFAIYYKPEIPKIAETTYAGPKVFQVYCASCHGLYGEEQKSGAALLSETQLGPDKIIQRIQFGKNAMPAFGTSINTQELDSIVLWIQELKEKK